MFKVVPDQLKVSGGWVRCGQCAEVFDASANLQSPPLSRPSQSVPAASVAQPEVSTPQADHPISAMSPEPSAAGLQQSVASDMDDSRQDSATVAAAAAAEVVVAEPWDPAVAIGDRLSGAAVASDAGVDDGYQSDFDPVAWKQKTGSDLAHEAEIPRQVSGMPSAPAGAMDGVIEPQDAEPDSSVSKLPAITETSDLSGDVSFVRDAIRKEFWRKPGIRISLGLLGLLLALALLLQVAVHQRDAIAALEPRLKPALQALCAEIGCELAPLKRIDVLVIESSSFSKVNANANANTYRLSFIIKNSGPVAVAMPSLEVTLTDTQEKPVLRRVILPAQFGAVSAILPAGSDFSGLFAFELSDIEGAGSAASGLPARVAGYRVLAFYP
jgi:predicted Zn finger-like uncharacterized protein